MRNYFLIAGVAVALGAATLGSMDVAAQAQTAPGAMPPEVQAGPNGHPMGGPPGWGMHMPWHVPQGGGPEGGRLGGWMHHGPHMPMMGLFYPSEDRALTGPDVQKIAEAFLLWNGNRAWKVANVVENQDNTVTFAFAAPDGTVIARFAVDRKSGHFHRLA